MYDRGHYEEHAGLLQPKLPAIFRHYEVRKTDQNNFLHWHEGIEIFYGTGGTGRVFCDGLSYELTKGTAVIINSGQLHRAQAESDCLEYEYLILEPPLWKEAGVEAELWFPCQRKNGDENMKYLMESAVRIRESEEEYGWLALKGVLLQIMARLLEAYALPESGNERDNRGRRMEEKGRLRMQAALIFLKTHYREPLTVGTVCRQAGYSPSHFSRQFREMAGMTLMEYINMLRCDGVRRMLLTESCSIQQAAEACGFSNMAHFYRMYRRFVGHLPSVEAKGEQLR